MPPAARKGDPTIHGGMITEGSPDTTIGGMPAARLLDKHVCPLHGPGPVTQTSFTVFINGLGSARMTDACTCMIPATGKGAGPKGKPGSTKFSLSPSKEWGETPDTYIKERGKDWEKKPASVFDPKLSASVSREFWKHGNAEDKKGAFETNVWSSKGEAKASADVDLTNLRNAKAEAGVAYKADYTAARLQGKAGDVKKGSFAEGEAEAKFLTVDANAGAGAKFQVKDGKLKSAYAEAKAGIGGSVVEGKVAGKTKAFKIPFTNWGISFGGEASGALLTAEAEASAYAGYRDNKWSIGFGAKLGAAIAGLGIKFNVSVEKLPPPEAPPPPPGVPGVAGIDPIALGCMTVLIGGVPPPYIPGPPKKGDKPGETVAGPGNRNKEEKAEYAEEPLKREKLTPEDLEVPVIPPTEAERVLAAADNVGGAMQAAQQAARIKVAEDFYVNRAGLTRQRAEKHIRGIDFNSPVKMVKFPPPDELAIFVGGDGRVGRYFTPVGTPADKLGIDPAKSVQKVFKVAPGEGLQSTTGDILVDWVPGKAPFHANGGGTQVFVSDATRDAIVKANLG